MSRKRCAVVLVVKDEAADIACWLAWHHIHRFDTCIVFDDDSTDGTWEILEHAAGVQDIRLCRTPGSREIFFNLRQQMAYRIALQLYADEFEWIAFFDADEYVSFSAGLDLAGFLDRFDDADGIAINWCNYGSSNHALKPQLPPVEAYTWHGDMQQPINRHVKSIVRPNSVGPHWLNMHAFDIALDRYRDASHNRFTWARQPGIMSSSPDWSVAKLMHFQCRSMEDFLARLRKRPDLPQGSNLWRGYDVNQVEDRAPLRLLPALHAQLARIAVPGRHVPPARPFRKETVMSDDSYQGLIIDIGVSEGNDTAYYLAKGFRVIAVEADPEQCRALRDRFAASIATGALLLLNFAAGEHFGASLEIFVHRVHQGISGIAKRAEVTDDYARHAVTTIDWRTLTAQAGIPRYLKIDIEGNEQAFLTGFLAQGGVPEFISVECHLLQPVEMLFEAGYRRFRLVDQKPAGGLQLPPRQLEGKALAFADFTHASGPFGLDLFADGIWTDLEDFKAAWTEARPRMSRTWFDCHAWKPS
ncbi:FkbM family methyltransferase [Lichenicoccus roseus]|uniref:FkbM family methyltransferase n=1 Tax=Lichenicoccus roseus TaxID=2683649 RepID=A0A5R9J6L8_9PROT|nr:FkbM family methyltransferase [Lichenicoccus roseus]TLU70996.1 FkbM family methyltransferase [Lichenicoccus roseus]